MLRDKQLVLFDAGYTLLAPTTSIADAYLLAAWSLGVMAPEPLFRGRLAELWSSLRDAYRSHHPDLESSEELERESWRRFTADLAAPFPDLAAVHSQWFDLLVEYFDSPSAWKANEGAEALLDSLVDRGVTIGIVSNWHSALHGILDGLRLLPYLSFVLTSAEVGRKKPHRAIFDAALTRAGVAPESAVHVGDSWEEDVLGARAVGIRPIHLRDQSAKPTEGFEDVRVVERLADLID